MPVRVLIVDDSGFFRRRIKDILDSDPRLDVIGEAKDGVEAIQRTLDLDPDIITMDIEMPVMDGITAVKEIMAKHPVPILMFSSLTTEGAQATLDAMQAGALDFLPKRLEDISGNREEALRQLRSKVFLIGAKGKSQKLHRNLKPSTARSDKSQPVSSPHKSAAPPVAQVATGQARGQYDIVTIGTSTGGPVALQEVLTKLPENFPVPIILIQHMPGSFTPAFAKRLDQLCKIHVKEGENGEELKPGWAYLAPGGKQMEVVVRKGKANLEIGDGDQSLNYRPSVDLTFNSIAKSFPGRSLAVVLTGMGADGREGARAMKSGGGTVWAQDEATCVVYGMPASIAEAGLADKILALGDVGKSLAQGFS
ncbi:MAG: chemotaxis response regulator protein-glutamate methylesterase [Gammaproteobacteria bacterium]|nr:chemotaxis response regulator protein-glutamate methylesterase [Gammaproteobacteria bacterium]